MVRWSVQEGSAIGSFWLLLCFHSPRKMFCFWRSVMYPISIFPLPSAGQTNQPFYLAEAKMLLQGPLQRRLPPPSRRRPAIPFERSISQCQWHLCKRSQRVGAFSVPSKHSFHKCLCNGQKIGVLKICSFRTKH